MTTLSSPSVAIVILNYNGKLLLQKFLPSVIQSTYINKKIVVADNASTDDSVTYLKQQHPTIQIITLSKNYGFSKGYNEALKQIRADYYILLNSDIEVQPQWVEPLIQLMEKDNTIAACQPKILSYNQPNTFEYAGACGGWIDTLGYPFARGRVINVCEEDKGQYDTTTTVFWASGAALCIRAVVYHQLGGLDEYFFAHQEEIDLCWRIQLAGYSVACCPLSIVYHVGGGTMPYNDRRKALLNHRNNLIMLYKNMPCITKLWLIPFRIGLDGAYAIISFFKGDSIYTASVFKAHVGFLNWLFFHQQKSVFPKKRFRVYKGVFRGSMVWCFFIKKKKYFSEIVKEVSNDQ